MSNIENLILFKAGTTKADLKDNVGVICELSKYTVDAIVYFNLDSNHILTIELFSSALDDIDIPDNGIIKTYINNSEEYFVIVNIDKGLTSITLSCRHWVTEILRSMFIVDSKPRLKTGQEMLEHFKNTSQDYLMAKKYAKDLEVYSNLSECKSINGWHDNFYNIVTNMQELWGCEIRKQGFEIALVDYVGSKTSVYSIEYGKNLISNTLEEDFSVITGVLAKGYDKLYADNIIYSGKLTDIKLGETKEFEYPVRIVKENEEKDTSYQYFENEEAAKAYLEELAVLEFTRNRVDEPIITFDTEFLDLSKTIEGGESANLTVGDKVSTYIPKFGISIETRVVEIEFDILSQKIKNVILSNNDVSQLKPPTLNSIQQEIIKTENKFQVKLEDEINGVSSKIEQTAENIRLEIEDVNNNLQSQIDINAEEIVSKVTAEDVETIVTQNAESWELSIKGKLKGTNYKFDGENFSIGSTYGNDKAYHSPKYSRWNHSDGSYSKISASGLERYSGSTKDTYHYYIKSGTILMNSGDQVYIEAPNHILDKEGVVIAVEQYVSPHTNNYIYSLNTCLITPFYEDGRVMIQARIKWNNLNTKKVEEGGFVYVHYLIVG